MSTDNVFDEELDYEMDDQNEEELLKSDEKASVTCSEPVTFLEPEKPFVNAEKEKRLEVADVAWVAGDAWVAGTAWVPEAVELAKEVSATPIYPLDLQTSNDLYEKSITTYYATFHKNKTSPTKEAAQSNGSKKVSIKPQRKKILVPEQVKIQLHSEHVRNAVKYDNLKLDATPLFSPIISLQTKSLGKMSGPSLFTVVNEADGYASDLLSKFGSLSTKTSCKEENEGTSVVDLRIVENASHNINGTLEKNIQPNIAGKLNGSGFQPRVPTKKSPFIIEASSAARKVLVNPLFDGFSQNIRKRPRSRDRNQNPYVITNIDLRHKILKKRKPSNILVESKSTNKTEEESPKEIQDVLILTDEEKNYLNEIEKQKSKREEILRQKEMNRQKEGWNFI